MEELYSWLDRQRIKSFKLSWGEGTEALTRHAQIILEVQCRSFLKLTQGAMDMSSYSSPVMCRSCAHVTSQSSLIHLDINNLRFIMNILLF